MIDIAEINDELNDRWDDVKNGPAEEYEVSLKNVKDLAGLLKEAKDMETERDLKRKELEIEEYKAVTERMKIESDERVAKMQRNLKIGGTVVAIVITDLVLFREDSGTITSKAWNFVSSGIGRMIPMV